MRAVIQFDECKPHWATSSGLDKVAEKLGMRDILVSGDFDAKVTYFHGNVDDFEAFSASVRANPSLSQGTLSEVIDDE